MSFNYFVLLGNKITLKFKLRSIWFMIFIYWKSKYVSITIYLLLQWFKKNKLTQRKISLKMLRVKVKKKENWTWHGDSSCFDDHHEDDANMCRQGKGSLPYLPLKSFLNFTIQIFRKNFYTEMTKSNQDMTPWKKKI